MVMLYEKLKSSLGLKATVIVGTWEHIKLGELLRHNTLGFFCCGRSLKIHMK
jgi:hypothetical protein